MVKATLYWCAYQSYEGYPHFNRAHYYRYRVEGKTVSFNCKRVLDTIEYKKLPTPELLVQKETFSDFNEIPRYIVEKANELGIIKLVPKNFDLEINLSEYKKYLEDREYEEILKKNGKKN